MALDLSATKGGLSTFTFPKGPDCAALALRLVEQGISFAFDPLPDGRNAITVNADIAWRLEVSAREMRLHWW